MQYTLRNVPREIDRALRETASRENKSLNQVTIEALRRATGLDESRQGKRRDLTDITGTWQDDTRIDIALADQRRIDPDMWE